MERQSTRVLFLSRRNAFRSLLAEACLRHLGDDKFKAYSCGIPSDVADAPYGWTLLALQSAGIPSNGLTCKGWTEFTRSGAPKMDFVIALDAQAFQIQPHWLGQPQTALWSYREISAAKDKIADPGIESIQTLVSLRRRIELLITLRARVQTNSQLREDLRDLAYV
jgi:protein-tyrosine-phosphatase